MNRRRTLLIALAASALPVPFKTFAQQPGKIWRVGFLGHRSRPDSLDSDIYGAFPRGMRELGYLEGKDLEIQWRYSEGKPERLLVETTDCNGSEAVIDECRLSAKKRPVVVTFQFVV